MPFAVKVIYADKSEKYVANIHEVEGELLIEDKKVPERKVKVLAYDAVDEPEFYEPSREMTVKLARLRREEPQNKFAVVSH